MAQLGFVGAIKMAEAYADASSNVYLPRQSDNPANIEAHEITTGPEIKRQLALFGRKADAFVAGIGTGGTVMSVGRHLRREGRTVRVHPLNPPTRRQFARGTRLGSTGYRVSLMNSFRLS